MSYMNVLREEAPLTDEGFDALVEWKRKHL